MNSSDLKNSDILIRYLSGETTPDEDSTVKQWIGESEENKLYLSKITAIWENSIPDSIDKEITDAKQLNNLFTAIDKKSSESTTKTRTMYKQLMRIAAVFVIGFIGYWFIMHNSIREKTIASKEKTNCTIKLADNSQVYLNTKTIISYPDKFNGNTREISMQKGEAFFEISPNKAKPFYIHTPYASIKVVGTSFNVRIDSITNVVSVVVATGTVLLYDNDKQENELLENNKLEVNECGEYTFSNKTVEKHTNTNYNYLTWKTGIFIFDKTPLKQVLSDLSAYYHVTFVVHDAEINSYNLSARYSNRTIDEIINMLKDTYAIDVKKNGTIISMKTIN